MKRWAPAADSCSRDTVQELALLVLSNFSFLKLTVVAVRVNMHKHCINDIEDKTSVIFSL